MRPHSITKIEITNSTFDSIDVVAEHRARQASGSGLRWDWRLRGQTLSDDLGATRSSIGVTAFQSLWTNDLIYRRLAMEGTELAMAPAGSVLVMNITCDVDSEEP